MVSSCMFQMEGDFQILSDWWHPSRDSKAFMSKESFCVHYLEKEVK